MHTLRSTHFPATNRFLYAYLAGLLSLCTPAHAHARTAMEPAVTAVDSLAERFAAVGTFLQMADSLHDNANYQYDAVDLIRQCLSDLSRDAYADIQQAWAGRDRAAFDRS